MVAAVAVETRQRAKRNKATPAEEEEEEKTPPPPPPPPDVRRPRQPTPDHPPYCWMIGEAIDALGEDGGSTEDAISTFIRAAHPGVPPAHDRFLRHYLAKHVAEGFFACTAPGRYARCPDEAAVVESPVEQRSSDSEAARVEPPVAQAKRRGRGRPRKNASSDSDAARVEPPVAHVKRRGRGRPRKDASSDFEAAHLKRRGRGRPRKDGLSSTPPAVKKGVGARLVTPKRRGRPRRAASLAAGTGSVPMSFVTAAADKDGNQATASKPRRRRRLRKLATSTDVSDEALDADKVEDGIDAPFTTGKEHGRSLELALVVVGDGAATTPSVDEASPSMPVDSDEPRDLALVTTTDVPAPMPPPADKQDGDDAASFNLTLAVKQDTISATSTAPEPSSQGCELALVAADDGPVPVSVAGKTDDGEAPSAMYKHLCQPRPREASPVIVAALRSALSPTSGAGKQARGKALSATPNAKGATGAHSAPMTIKLTPVTAGGGNGAPSVAPKLYPLTAEIPDDPSWCLLALPAAANAC